MQYSQRKETVVSFANYSAKTPINLRILACQRAAETRRKEPLRIADASIHTGKIADFLGRQTHLPNLELMRKIDPSTIKSVREEMLTLNMLTSNKSVEEKQIAIYRVMIAGLMPILNFK